VAKILVTGSSGFIGKNLISKLRSNENIIQEVNSANGDISNEDTWSKFENANVLIHLASRTFVPDSWLNPDNFLKINLHGTVCALNYCRKHNATFVYISSYLYGNPELLPVSESSRLEATNPYALSKKLAEETCKFYSDFYGVRTIILRPFNVYGKNQSDLFLIPSIIKQVLGGEFISVKDLEPKRDYVYIDDLVDAIILATTMTLKFLVLNIGTGTSYSTSELIDIIQNIMGTNLPIISTGEKRKGEIMDTKADITKAIENLNWHPKYSLPKGLEKMLSDYFSIRI
jgi:nucleoside-diphosphate-sugar epimerase